MTPIIPVLATTRSPAIVPSRTSSLVSATAPIPETISVLPAVQVSTKPKREPSEDFDEKLYSCPQGVKRVRTICVEEESEFAVIPEPTNASDVPKIVRRGCPGDFWKCKPDELEKRTYWTSFLKFRKHFEAHHLDGNLTDDYRWKCHLCDHDSFGANGHNLMMHFWDTHFK
ncbi:unnamed protein product [Alternaria alternata]